MLCAEADATGRPRRGAALAAAYAFGLFLTGVSWVYVSLHVFGGMPAALAGLATVLFCGVLTLSTAVAGALFVCWAAPGWLARAVLFGSLWLLAEWSRGCAFTGFPWLAAGYAQTPPSPLAGYAPLVGVYGVSLLTALVGAIAFEVIRRWLSTTECDGRPWLRWCPALPLLIVGLILSVGSVLREIRWTEPAGEPLTVALLQGNVAQEMKWRPERFVDSLRTYYRLALEHPARLTVLPETALPAFLEQVPAAYLEELEQLAIRREGNLVFGIAVNARGRYFNSAVSLGVDGRQRYDKVHLVPFGEFVPPGFAWFMELVNIPLSDFSAGPVRQPPLQLTDQRVAINICYEDVFGEEIIAALPAATLLVNVSNVAWFGDSLAPAQHLQIARMRALESGRVMLRATNTGMTAIVGADGRVQSVLPPFSRGALVAEVRGYTGATPYVQWGNGPGIILALLLVAVTKRRRLTLRDTALTSTTTGSSSTSTAEPPPASPAQ